MRDLEMRFTAESERLRAEHAQASGENEARYRRDWTKMSERWLTGMERFRAGIEGLGRTCRDYFPDW